jgi:predicted transcriptional regulator
MSDTENNSGLVELAADVASAYVSNNVVPVADLGTVVENIYAALLKVSGGSVAVAAISPEPLVPAVPIKKSVTPDHIICLEDGKRFKSLKRHLASRYNLTPDEYKAKWGLPSDYPMVAPNYAASRSELAKRMGLGERRKTAA